MSPPKACFFNAERPCDLTCKAAFEVDDPVDNVDCYFIWLAHHFGEGLFEVRRILEQFGGAAGGAGGPGGPFGGGPMGGGFGPGAGPGAPGPKGKGPSGPNQN